MLTRCVKLWQWGARKVLRSVLSPFFFFFCTFFLFTCATDFAEKEGLELLFYLFFEVISLSQMDWLPQIVMRYFKDGSFAVWLMSWTLYTMGNVSFVHVCCRKKIWRLFWWILTLPQFKLMQKERNRYKIVCFHHRSFRELANYNHLLLTVWTTLRKCSSFTVNHSLS